MVIIKVTRWCDTGAKNSLFRDGGLRQEAKCQKKRHLKKPQAVWCSGLSTGSQTTPQRQAITTFAVLILLMRILKRGGKYNLCWSQLAETRNITENAVRGYGTRQETWVMHIGRCCTQDQHLLDDKVFIDFRLSRIFVWKTKSGYKNISTPAPIVCVFDTILLPSQTLLKHSLNIPSNPPFIWTLGKTTKFASSICCITLLAWFWIF